MTSIKQKKLCQQLGIQFKNETLLLQALTHRSADPKIMNVWNFWAMQF